MIANMGKGKHISMETLTKICETLDCEINGISRFVSCSSAPEKGSLYAKGGKLVSPSENMDNESKETLLKVADYNELEKQRAAKVGNLSFGIMFLVCAITIVVQMLMTGNLSLIIGETVILFAGGLIYIFGIVKNGAWNGAMTKNAPKKDLIFSLMCVGIFSILFFLILKKNATTPQAIGIAVCFFIVLSIISYFLLRELAYLSQRKSDKLKD